MRGDDLGFLAPMEMILEGVQQLAAEVQRRRKAENALLKAEPDFVGLVARAVRDEGDRIKREVLAEIERYDFVRECDPAEMHLLPTGFIRAALDRIVLRRELGLEQKP